MPWFGYKKTHAGTNPQILFQVPANGAGAASWNEFVQYHKIEDHEVSLGINALRKLYPLRVEEEKG